MCLSVISRGCSVQSHAWSSTSWPAALRGSDCYQAYEGSAALFRSDARDHLLQQSHVLGSCCLCACCTDSHFSASQIIIRVQEVLLYYGANTPCKEYGSKPVALGMPSPRESCNAESKRVITRFTTPVHPLYCQAF